MRARYADAVERKRDRLAAGEKPRVLDICGGAGGFSLGFKAAGFELIGAIETDPVAVSTYVTNLHRNCSAERKALLGASRDLNAIKAGKVIVDLGLGPVQSSVDVILAGLPCQAFARIGRSKLGSLAEDPSAYRTDSRAGLYRRLLEYVRALMPLGIVVENVPDILNHGGHNVPEEISSELTASGYRCRYTLLNAAAYGVPQLRERLFLVALHDALGESPTFPAPTHHVEAPTGYASVRRTALKHVDVQHSHYVAPAVPSDPLPSAITVREALDDLAPVHRAVWDRDGPAPSRHITQTSAYGGPPSAYALAMRTWEGFATADLVDAHVVRHTPRDYALFREMKHGEQYPEMYRRAIERFEAELGKRRQKALEIPEGSDAWRSLKAAMVPPYDPTKFPNKWRKLQPDRPSWTLTAHLCRDTYSHIHYDPDQARTISVREAARLQSFPDGFVFSGTMNSSFRQIGNAVPPLMARAIALGVLKSLSSRNDVPQSVLGAFPPGWPQDRQGRSVAFRGDGRPVSERQAANDNPRIPTPSEAGAARKLSVCRPGNAST